MLCDMCEAACVTCEAASTYYITIGFGLCFWHYRGVLVVFLSHFYNLV